MGVITGRTMSARKVIEESTSMLVAQQTGRIRYAGGKVSELLNLGIRDLTGLDIREIFSVELPPPSGTESGNIGISCSEGKWINRAASGEGRSERIFELTWKPVQLGWVTYWQVGISSPDDVSEQPVGSIGAGIKSESASVMEPGAMIPGRGNWQIMSFHRPVESNGGDILLLEEINPEYILYFLGDVAGHSRGAKIVRMMLTSYLRLYREDFNAGKVGSFPGTLLDRLNNALCEDDYNDSLLTGLVVLLEKHGTRAWYASAGHNPIYLVKQGEGSTALETPDIPLGIHQGIHYRTRDISCGPKDRLLCFTDGLITNGVTRGINENLGSLLNALESNRETSNEDLPTKLQKFVKRGGNGIYYCSNDLTFSIISHKVTDTTLQSTPGILAN